MATLPAPRSNWTRSETLAALHVYLQLPFGQLHHRNPKIKQLSAWIGRTPGSIALKLVNLASLDPAIVASGRKGMGNASALDRQIWQELQTSWDKVALESAATFEKLAVKFGMAAEAIPDEAAAQPYPEGKTRTATVQVRVNQARFRQYVLASYNATCCISGLQNEKLVIASHIVPWSEDSENRLNPQNGLCLSALHDRAYDQGLITVTPDYKIHVSPKLIALKGDTFMGDSLLRFNNQSIRLPEKFRPGAFFLARHAARFGFI
jgi:putative restriction endonuclease